MKKIPLTKGKYALVDDEDYDFLMRWKWQYNPRGYAQRGGDINDQISTVRMHRQIMNVEKGIEIDHQDYDGLNNQKSNLRLCNRSQNVMNRRKLKKTGSKFKGVSWDKKANKWRSRIRQKWLGNFSSEIEAAKAYNEAAIEYFGDFAWLNET